MPKTLNLRTKISTDNSPRAVSDFICAPATAAGARSAIAVIRASGSSLKPGALFVALGESFTTRTGKVATELGARETHYGHLKDSEGEIDDIIFVKFAGTASFTGEDSFEINCHGNPLIIRRILALLYTLGFRAAEPGEFTRRAYLNGKLGLDAAQAVAEIIEARSALSLKAAQRLSQGHFRKEMLLLRSQLMNLLADLNAELDFIDEDISFATRETKLKILSDTEAAALRLEKEAARFDRLKGGVHIAIVGVPNAGKSSLMNRFLGHDRSIVSDIAGTTRDYIEAEIEIAGVNIRLFDTAGLRENSPDAIEQLGIERTHELISRAHICLLLIDGSEPRHSESLSPNIAPTAKRLTVVNKNDVLHPSWNSIAEGADKPIFLSARTGEGMPALLAAIGDIVTELAPADALPLSDWQRNLLAQIAHDLHVAGNAVQENELPEVISHTVNEAVRKIAELTGDITSEDILGRIFSRFCIGK